jgi:transposase-like protein
MRKSKEATTRRPNLRQRSLFAESAEDRGQSVGRHCEIVSVGKRRDGGTRYWCLTHRADATAKYGKRASKCRAADAPGIRPEDTLDLYVDKYPGGIALWGAVPAVYDTTRLPMDRGIHVHARASSQSAKEIDRTFRAVRVLGSRLPDKGILVSELDAIYYMVASIAGYETKYVTCSYCGYPHLDRDWFSVHPHRRHLCAGCGKHFRDNDRAVGNPIAGVQAACGVTREKPTAPDRTLRLIQKDYPGGIQVWGSNPAFLWTSRKSEEEGIHVHAYKEDGRPPEIDETYSEVNIDGTDLDAHLVRTLMAQLTLPSLKDRVLSVKCPSCGAEQQDVGEFSFSASIARTCHECGSAAVARGRMRKVVANPLVSTLSALAERAPRPRQRHDLGLAPETL